jgi:hypothetical protein
MMRSVIDEKKNFVFSSREFLKKWIKLSVSYIYFCKFSFNIFKIYRITTNHLNHSCMSSLIANQKILMVRESLLRDDECTSSFKVGYFLPKKNTKLRKNKSFQWVIIIVLSNNYENLSAKLLLLLFQSVV